MLDLESMDGTVSMHLSPQKPPSPKAAHPKSPAHGECSPSHHLVYLGLVGDSYCGCNKATCRVMPTLDHKTGPGAAYTPRPIDVSKTELTVKGADDDRASLIRQLCVFVHDSWASMRVKAGWKLGKRRDSVAKLHPDLLPYDELPQQAKRSVDILVQDMLKTIIALGFLISKGPFREGLSKSQPTLPDGRPDAAGEPSVLVGTCCLLSRSPSSLLTACNLPAPPPPAQGRANRKGLTSLPKIRLPSKLGREAQVNQNEPDEPVSPTPEDAELVQ